MGKTLKVKNSPSSEGRSVLGFLSWLLEEVEKEIEEHGGNMRLIGMRTALQRFIKVCTSAGYRL